MLWIRRGTPPRVGFWTVPGGYVEPGESPAVAAAREIREETGAIVNSADLKLILVGVLPHMKQLYLGFMGHLDERSHLRETEEASEIALYSREEVPYSDLTYPQVRSIYDHIYDEIQSQHDSRLFLGRFENGLHIVKVVC